MDVNLTKMNHLQIEIELCYNVYSILAKTDNVNYVLTNY